MSFDPNQPRNQAGRWTAAQAFAAAANRHIDQAEAEAKRVGSLFAAHAQEQYAKLRAARDVDDEPHDTTYDDADEAVKRAISETVPGPMLDHFAGSAADGVMSALAEGKSVTEEDWQDAVESAREGAKARAHDAGMRVVPEAHRSYIDRHQWRVADSLQRHDRVDADRVFAMTDARGFRKGVSLSGTPVAVLHSAKLAPSKSIPLGLTGRPTSRKLRTNNIASRNADGSPVFEERELPVEYRKKEVAKVGEWTHRGTGEPVPITRDRIKKWAENTTKLIAAGAAPFLPNRHRWDVTDADADEPLAAGDNFGKVIAAYVEGDSYINEYMLVGEQAQIADAANDVSICIMDGMLDAKGNRYGEAQHHLAIVHNPALPGLAPSVRIAASGDVPEHDVPVTVLELAEEVWRTINGTHVRLDKDGTIAEGPAHMKGKKPHEIGDGGKKDGDDKGGEKAPAAKEDHDDDTAPAREHAENLNFEAEGLTHKMVEKANSDLEHGGSDHRVVPNGKGEWEHRHIDDIEDEHGENWEVRRNWESGDWELGDRDAHDEREQEHADDPDKIAESFNSRTPHAEEVEGINERLAEADSDYRIVPDENGKWKAQELEGIYDDFGDQPAIWQDAKGKLDGGDLAAMPKGGKVLMRLSAAPKMSKLLGIPIRSRLLLALHGGYNPSQPRDADGKWTDTGIQPDRPRVPNLVPRTPMGEVVPEAPTAALAQAHERRALAETPEQRMKRLHIDPVKAARREKRREAEKAKYALPAEEAATADRHAHLAQAFQSPEDFAKAEATRAEMLKEDERVKAGGAPALAKGYSGTTLTAWENPYTGEKRVYINHPKLASAFGSRHNDSGWIQANPHTGELEVRSKFATGKSRVLHFAAPLLAAHKTMDSLLQHATPAKQKPLTETQKQLRQMKKDADEYNATMPFSADDVRPRSRLLLTLAGFKPARSRLLMSFAGERRKADYFREIDGHPVPFYGTPGHGTPAIGGDKVSGMSEPTVHPEVAKLKPEIRATFDEIQDSPGGNAGMFDKGHVKKLAAAGLVKVDASSGSMKVFPLVTSAKGTPAGSPTEKMEAVSAEGSPPRPYEVPAHPVGRSEAASHIEAALNGEGYTARTWTGGSNIRVYVSDAKGKLGFISVEPDGTLSAALERQRGTVMSKVPELKIKPEQWHGSVAGKDEPPDDPLERMEWEERRKSNFITRGDFG